MNPVVAFWKIDEILLSWCRVHYFKTINVLLSIRYHVYVDMSLGVKFGVSTA